MRFNTVTKKSVFAISIIGLIVILLINILFPTIFYEVMKPHLIKQISSIVSANALRLSYIWRNNLILHQIRLSEEIKNLVSDYYSYGERSDEIKKKLLTFLPTINSGRVSTGILGGQSQVATNYGYIVSTHYLMLFTSEGDMFFNRDAESAAKVIAESDWYKNFDKNVYSEDNELFEYIPVITSKSDPNIKIACKVDSFQAGDIII